MNTFAKLVPPEQIQQTERPLHGYARRGELVVDTGTYPGSGREIFRLSHPALIGLDPDALGEIATLIAGAIGEAHRVGFQQGRSLLAEALNIRALIDERLETSAPQPSY